MSDNLTKSQRSYCMSNIRSKWTTQESKIHNYLKGNKIKHKMHPNITGSPDILLTKNKTVIFLHGCFWHRCPKCFKEPKTRMEYWIPKIENNVKRDKRNERNLKKEGYKVLKLWEHEIKKNLKKCVKKIEKYK
ncbi:DNA mismatch endonuclease Vsr [Candidatus Woesearchaeota archaeon]|nr:DNA mismatch endonuclease Vsr [Candidatus Woesearchaeota archaeon]